MIKLKSLSTIWKRKHLVGTFPEKKNVGTYSSPTVESIGSPVSKSNTWIFLSSQAAMTLDGKIATSSGQSKWITGSGARKHAMKLRYGMDAMLVGIETVIADDPSLTVRLGSATKPSKKLFRIVLSLQEKVLVKLVGRLFPL